MCIYMHENIKNLFLFSMKNLREMIPIGEQNMSKNSSSKNQGKSFELF